MSGIDNTIRQMFPGGGQQDAADADSSDEDDEDYVDADGDVLNFRENGSFVDPEQVDDGYVEVIKLGDMWFQGLYVDSWPDYARPGFLSPLMMSTNHYIDFALHATPIDRDDAIRDLQERVTDLEAELDERRESGDTTGVADIKPKWEKAEQLYKLVANQGVSVFDASMYVAHRGDNRDGLKKDLPRIRNILEKPPMDLDTKVATNQQDRLAMSASPAATDEIEWTNNVPAGALGSACPFVTGSLMEEGGVDVGINRSTSSPVIVDRFARDSGYNKIVIGDIGAGKSFSSKLNLIRTIQSRPDVDVVILDPKQEFVGVSKALEGEKIMVGGNAQINPLEIKETPQEVLDSAGDDFDPYSAKIKEVMTFFETYYKMRGTEDGGLDSTRRGVLDQAIRKAYDDKGITSDPRTHGNDSPTIRDVMRVLKEISEETERYTSGDSQEERDMRAKAASKILIDLEPFREGGPFANLAKPTEGVDLFDNRITYLDLQQQETSGGTGLMMQLLFGMVYERIKQSDRKTIFVIDEARYIMKESASLDFLEQVVRHSRHHDLSLQFITQTVEEFFEKQAAETIVGNCSMRKLHKIKDLPEDIAREHFDLNQRQIDFVREAQLGKDERDYSEALTYVEEEGWFPIRIKATEPEKTVIEYEPEDPESDLPGYEDTQKTALTQRLEGAIEEAEPTISTTGLGETVEQKISQLEDVKQVGIDDGIEQTIDPESLSREELLTLVTEFGLDHLPESELPEEVQRVAKSDTGGAASVEDDESEFNFEHVETAEEDDFEFNLGDDEETESADD